MHYPTAEQRSIRCHAGPEEPAPAPRCGGIQFRFLDSGFRRNDEVYSD